LGVKEWWAKKNEKWEEEERLEKIEKEKHEEERNKFQEILDKFEIPELKNFFKNFLGTEPPEEIEEDSDTGRKRVIKPDRKTHVDFIMDYYAKGELKFNQLKDYALKHKLVSPSFFGIDSPEAGEQREFETLMNSISADFEPENIKDEEHLQSQLTIFLKAKFPDKKVEREVRIKSGDKLDILVDGKYVFELKVPKARTDLRNLSAQLEEYRDEYPYLCAVIADISGAQNDDTVDIETRLTENIKEYVDKYKVKMGIPSLIFDVKKRG